MFSESLSRCRLSLCFSAGVLSVDGVPGSAIPPALLGVCACSPLACDSVLGKASPTLSIFSIFSVSLSRSRGGPVCEVADLTSFWGQQSSNEANQREKGGEWDR